MPIVLRLFLLSCIFLSASALQAQQAAWVIDETRYDKAVFCEQDSLGGLYIVYITRGDWSLDMVVQKRNADLSIAWEKYYSEFFINTNSSGEWDHIFYRAMLIDSGNYFLVHYELEPAGGEAGWRGEYIKIFDAVSGNLVRTIRPEGVTKYWSIMTDGSISYTNSVDEDYGNYEETRIKSSILSAEPPFSVNKRTRAVLPFPGARGYSQDSSILAVRKMRILYDSLYSLHGTIPLTYLNRGEFRENHFLVDFLDIDFNKSAFTYCASVYGEGFPYPFKGTIFAKYDIANSSVFDSVFVPVKTGVDLTEYQVIASEEKLVRHSSDSNVAYREVFDFEGKLLEEDSLLNFFEQKFYYSLQVDSLVIWAGEKGGNAYLIAKERDGVTGMSPEHPQNRWHIYPNPAENQVEITGDFKGNLFVYNSNGRLVLEGYYSGNKRIDCSRWSPGLYFMVLEGNSRKQTAKFVIQ